MNKVEALLNRATHLPAVPLRPDCTKRERQDWTNFATAVYLDTHYSAANFKRRLVSTRSKNKSGTYDNILIRHHGETVYLWNTQHYQRNYSKTTQQDREAVRKAVIDARTTNETQSVTPTSTEGMDSLRSLAVSFDNIQTQVQNNTLYIIPNSEKVEEL